MNLWRRIAPPLLAGALPATLLSVGVARFILRHFFVHAPYLQDAGWYSAIVYHAGVLPHNPIIACDYADWYYGVHFSPFVSVFSLLSYLIPLPRIEWYALFEAIVYLPIGIATYALSSSIQPTRALGRLPITFVAALAFAFSGQVLWMISYPHYEAVIPGLVCLVLVSLVTRRARLSWVLLVVTASVREDAGFHVALALAPLLYLHWRGVEMPASRRKLVKMIAVAFFMSIAASLCQKVFFHPVNLFRAEYLGDPIYGHISVSALIDRTRNFFGACQFILYPFIASVLIAALRRDPRYLLGWAASAPWFILNFTAFQEAKSSFHAYTGFPFVVSVFWLFVYGSSLAPVARRMSPRLLESMFAAVCITSIIGAYQADPWLVRVVAAEMTTAQRTHRPAVHGFVDALEAHRAEFGRLYVDPSVAAIALESVQPDNLWHGGVAADTIVFHRDSLVREAVLRDLIANRLDICTHVLGTGLFVCSRGVLARGTFAGLATAVVARTDVLWGHWPLR